MASLIPKILSNTARRLPGARRETVCFDRARRSSGSLAMLAAMRRDRHRWPGALTCAKVEHFVRGDASEPPSLCTECYVV